MKTKGVTNTVGCAENEVKDSDALGDYYRKGLSDDQRQLGCDDHNIAHVFESIPHHTTALERDTKDGEKNNNISNLNNDDAR